jgi:hypothetical protein
LRRRGPGTVAKAYRLIKSIFATAVEDGLIRRNPCRIKGASAEKSPERPVLTVAEVYALAALRAGMKIAKLLRPCGRAADTRRCDRR